MLPVAINHMTVPTLHYDALFRLARALGCAGVELRNDLARPLFDGDSPEKVVAAARANGLRIVGLSQIHPFNTWSDSVGAEVERLIAQAKACGAETISLIPRNDGRGTAPGERKANLETSLREIAPMLEAAELVALIEPLGFETSSLRSKAEAVEAIEKTGVMRRFKLVHDTFHHHIAGRGPLFPAHTGIVHVSGVVDSALGPTDMRDKHRVLVDAADRLGNIEQLRALREAGYAGVISFEAFAPGIHAMTDPEPALRRSIEFITHKLAAVAA
jgi:2-keto-myo-inositol isomerase